MQFLEHIELDRAIETGEDGGDAVTLITLHNTKGLEFKRVIITGNEQGIFPRHDKKDQELEEERRLFYVGVTRAMDELYLTSCAMRRMYGRTAFTEPSLFLFEADRRYLRVLGEAPPGFAGGGGPDRTPAVGNPQSYAATAKQAPAYPRQALKVSSDKRWRVGDRVFHDDHGYGQVTGIQEDPQDGPLIRVRFETSRELRFLSRYQSGGYIKLGAD